MVYKCKNDEGGGGELEYRIKKNIVKCRAGKPWKSSLAEEKNCFAPRKGVPSLVFAGALRRAPGPYTKFLALL